MAISLKNIQKNAYALLKELFHVQGSVVPTDQWCKHGQPLAPSLANLENNLLNAKFTTAAQMSNIHPNLYRRYVDDIIAIFDNEVSANLFLNVLNSLHPSIQFTLEVGNKSLDFLDVNMYGLPHPVNYCVQETYTYWCVS